MNCRSVSPKTWEHARQALVFYFSRRHALSNAEDLAQETLATIWSRTDYEFGAEEEFLKVCYGFAAHVLQTAWRQTKKDVGPAIDAAADAAPMENPGLRSAEWRVYLSEVLRLGEEQLRAADWELIRTSALAGNQHHVGSPVENSVRVRLHRARTKLAKLAGWRAV